MFKMILIAVIFVGLLTSASAFSEIESYEDAVPILEELGTKTYLTLQASFDFGQEMIDVWIEEKEI